jgi:hypothetical protein
MKALVRLSLVLAVFALRALPTLAIAGVAAGCRRSDCRDESGYDSGEGIVGEEGRRERYRP